LTATEKIISTTEYRLERPTTDRNAFLPGNHDTDRSRVQGSADSGPLIIRWSLVRLQPGPSESRRKWPTLFAVKKFLPERYHGAWENVNWSFSNEYADEDVSRDSDVTWRPPLPVSLQNAAISQGIDMESIWTLGGAEGLVSVHCEFGRSALPSRLPSANNTKGR
jgi:hypothetical protein